MTYYIQRKSGRDLETVDEFTTYKEARAMVAEYRMSDPSAHYYISSRACAAWRATS
jgi:hypothetical protein